MLYTNFEIQNQIACQCESEMYKIAAANIENELIYIHSTYFFHYIIHVN